LGKKSCSAKRNVTRAFPVGGALFDAQSVCHKKVEANWVQQFASNGHFDM
jgi:hypothetical protein